MEEVRQLVQEEGREARNLVAFHVAVDTPGKKPPWLMYPWCPARVSRKPPRGGATSAGAGSANPPRRPAPNTVRLRSASAGRDKRTELRARYWALLFGDLQRAIGEIYNTVEAHENLNECQEVILVLENYMRDFKALCEWFRLKWEYDNTPPPQRPQSLAWEIRKTDFVRPESRRTYSVKSSPSASGKNSPCLSGHNTPSGKNSPNLTGKTSPGSGKVSPRVSGQSNVSPKVNIEFLSNKAAIKSEPKTTKDISRLSDIKEKDIKENAEEIGIVDVISSKDSDDKSVNQTTVEIGKAKECPNICPRQVVIKSPKRTVLSQDINDSIYENISSQAKATIFKLDTMENEFLVKQLTDNKAKNENQLNRDKEFEYTKNYSQKFGSQENNSSLENNVIEKGHETPIDKKISVTSYSSEKSGDNFVDVSNDNSYKHTDRKLAMTDKNNLCEINVITEPIIAEVMDIEEKNTKLSPSTKLIEKDDRKENASNSFQEEVVDLKTDVDSIKLFHIDTSNVKDVKKDMDPKKIDSKTMTEKQARPAYSQAAAKPKPTSTLKTELKTPNTTTRLIVRSKTVVEIRPNPTPKPLRQLPKRNQTNKCSYPFNLTTGRTSLFDGPSNKALSKKPINRIQTSGDVKTNPKVDLKKPPSRPINLKINEKGDKKEIMNTTLENIKDCEEYSSCDTIVTQIDISRIESNESLKTLVPEDADITNSIEMLNVTNNRNDNDGWLTVKSRRLSRESKKQSKSHWANRFHQPSATTSLPTLNMIISPKQEIKQIVNNTKLDRAQSEQPQNKPKVSKSKETKKDLAMIRQKSDVTGLKTRTSRSKALKREKLKDMSKEKGKLIKNRLHSSLESLTTGLARSQESTQDAFDFDKWKAEFKSTLNFLDEDDQIPNHNEILKSADPSEMSEIAEMTSQIEENEKKISWALDFQSEVDQRKLCEEEDLLNRQIMELQQVSDVDLDTETDDTETDAEILCEDSTPGPSCPSVENLRSLAASLEDQYETALAGMSWAERVDTLGALEALVARDPGRAQQLHAKLSQGIKRRGSLQDALRRLQAKQARAERQRLEYQTERAKKIHQLLARVEEVKVAKNQLIDEKRIRMERRLQKAAENRDQYLKDIVRKAHDEEEKLREIAFIKQLEAENRRHEFLDQCRSHTTRLRQMRRDRLSKLEQKAAREAAVGARRQALELARKLHVETLLERRKERDARLEELKELKKQERGDAAREKAEGVKSRLSALAAAAELEADALRSRIRDKQDASQQRLESHLQAIREKATGPRQPTTSESQDQSTKEEKELQEEAERLEQERKEKEKQKAIKKKARKVKQKLLSTSNETIVRNDLSIHSDITIPGSNKILKVIHQLSNMITPLQKTDSIERNENETADTEHTKNKKSAKYKNKTLIEDAEDKSFKKNENNNNNNVETVAIKIETLNGDYKDKTSRNKNNNKNIENSVKNKNEALNGDANDKTMNVNENKNDEISHKDKNETTNSESNNKKSNKTINKNIEILKSEECNSKNQNANIDNAKIENVSAKKKNKKSKGDKSDQPKLSKTSSVCSSLSDMSRGSCKSDKRLRQVIDMPYLERLLNELHRLMEKIDRSDKSSYIRVLVVKVLGQLISVAAEREEFAPQFTIKSLATAVVIISRVLATCSRSAAYFMGASACVHAVKLLSNQLERDLLNDPKEMELTKQLCDCLSLGLDSVLCSSRLYDESKCSAKELELLITLRSRTHTLISYICLSGCITRAEKAGEVREAVQTLLTVCADLCHPFGADEGPELPSAVQSLRCALGTGVCGSRAEFCMLFAHGAGLQHGGGFVRAARTAHLLRGLAHLDHQIVQDAFGEGGWPLEFRAAVARLLSQHAPNDKEAPRTKALRISNQRLDQTLSETMVLDLIVLVGFVVVNNPQLQETICDGWSVIKTLCTLPANWLVSRPHCHALLPTLVALSDCPTAQATIAAELSIGMLEEYMRSPEAQEVKLVQVIKQGRVKKSGKK